MQQKNMRIQRMPGFMIPSKRRCVRWMRGYATIRIRTAMPHPFISIGMTSHIISSTHRRIPLL